MEDDFLLEIDTILPVMDKSSRVEDLIVAGKAIPVLGIVLWVGIMGARLQTPHVRLGVATVDAVPTPIEIPD
jgi:hypothetical protein